MTKMLIISDKMSMGGIQKILINILKGIDTNKYNITLYLPFPGGELETEIPSEINVKYLYKKDPRTNVIKKILYYLFQININKNINKSYFIKDEYDIAIAYKTAMVGYLNGLKSKKICFIHSPLIDVKNPILKYIYRKHLISMDKVICVSQGTKNNIIEFLGTDEEKIIVQYNPINIQEIIAKSKEPIGDIKKSNHFQMVSVGRLDKNKGFDRMLDVCKMLRNDGFLFELWIIGEGNEKNSLIEKINSSSLGGIVSLLGQKNNPYVYIKNADLFICTSYSEGYSTVISEALVLGKPVISTNVIGTNEPLVNGKYGMLVDDDTMSIYYGVLDVLKNKDTYLELCSKAEKASIEIKSSNKIREIENIFDKVIKN